MTLMELCFYALNASKVFKLTVHFYVAKYEIAVSALLTPQFDVLLEICL